MISLGICLKSDGDKMNISIKSPTEKQLSKASDNEKVILQVIKDILDTKLIDLINEYQNKEK